MFSSCIMLLVVKDEYLVGWGSESALRPLPPRLRMAVIKAEMRRHDPGRTKNAQAAPACGDLGH